MRSSPYADAPRLPEGAPIDPRLLLGEQTGAVELEIGPARGGFMVERLLAAPDRGLIGLEIRRKWASLADQRLRRRGFGHRARVYAEDARLVLPRLSAGSLRAVYLHFPDPWWKKRHQKRLLVTSELLAQIARVLVPEGELFVQTDVVERADAYQKTIDSMGQFRPYGQGPRVDENPYQARSLRERRVLQDGLPVHRLRYRRVAP